MENNENKQTETTEDANTQLTREEILASSREENKQGDEREKNIYRKGASLALGIGLLLMGIISLVNTIVVDNTPVELWVVYTGMMAVWWLYYGIKVNNKHRPLYLACGIICSITCVFFTVSWILELCGIMVL